MINKEKLNLIISKVPEEQKEAFVNELRDAESKQDRAKVLKKYGINITDEEYAVIKDSSHEVSDDELDSAAAGCCSHKACTCNTCSCD